MSHLNDLEFVQRDLFVTYRASTDVQRLFIDVDTRGTASVANVKGTLGILIDIINAGAARSYEHWTSH